MNGPLINYNSGSRFLDYDSKWSSCDWIIAKNIILTQINTHVIQNVILLVNVRGEIGELWKTGGLKC